MGSKLDKPQIQGLLVPSDRVSPDTLDADASSYTEADPGPGQPVSTDPRSKLTLEISGGQQTAIELLVRRAGLPEVSSPFGAVRGLGVQWRPLTDTDEGDWRGKNPPFIAHAWFGAAFDPAQSFDRFDLVVTPVSQQLVLVYVDSSETHALSGTAFDFTDPGWGPAVTVSANADAAGGADTQIWDWVTATALPNDRILALGYATGQFTFDTYASDDRGQTWSKYADAPVGALGVNTIGRVVYFRGQMALFLGRPGFALTQQASRDLATSWSAVPLTSTLNVNAVAVDVLANEGGIVLATLDSADARIRVRVLQSAFQPFDEVTAVTVVDEAMLDVLLAVDGAGAVWVWGRTSVDADEIKVFLSVDEGQSFTEAQTSAFGDALAYRSGNNAIVLTNLVGRFCRGHLVAAHNSSAPVSAALAGNVGTLWCAGWSNRVAPDGGFAWFDATTQRFQTGVPVELPVNISADWTNVGLTAPTIVAPGELSFDVAAQPSIVQLDPATATRGNPMTVGFSFRIASGSFAASSLVVGAAVRVADAVGTYDLELRLGNDEAIVHDAVANSTIATIVLDNTAWHDWLISVSDTGDVVVAYREPLSTRWIDVVVATGVLALGTTTTANNRFRLGVFINATGTVRSRHWFVGERGFTDLFQRGREDLLGGTITTAKSPIPGLGSELRAGFLSASRGPGRRNETFVARPFYAFGVDNLFPQVSPSPSRPWRSLDTAEQAFVFDLRTSSTDDDRLGPVWHHALVLVGCNFRQAVVEWSRDGVSWQSATVAGGTSTYDAATGFTGLSYTRQGHGGASNTAWLRPTNATAAGARPLARGELVGGHAVISGVAYPITANSPGVWSAAVAVGSAEAPVSQIAEVRIEGMAPATGLVDLVWPSGVLFSRSANGNPGELVDLVPGFAQKVRLRIPASQPTVDGYYQIGAMLLGSTLVLGKRSSGGWSQSMEPNVSQRVSRFGTIRKRRFGPNRRRWTWNWADGVAPKFVRDGGLPDFLALGPDATAGAALALRDDVWTNLWGLLDELSGGEIPLVALAALPLGGDGVQTDRTLFLYATLDSAIQFDQVQGDEGDDEFGRVAPIRFTELV